MRYNNIKIEHSSTETQSHRNPKQITQFLSKRSVLEDSNCELNEENWTDILQRNQSSDKEIQRRHLAAL